MATNTARRPWEDLRRIIVTADADRLAVCLERLGPAETALAVSRLDSDEQTQLLTLLSPDDAADLVDDVPQAQAADLIEEMDPAQAAPIIDAMASDKRADLLGEMDDPEIDAILEQMAPDQAEAVQALLTHTADSAGGLMITEYLSYPDDCYVNDVLSDLQGGRDKYADYSVQYLYVVDQDGKLRGVLRNRDLLFTPHSAALGAVMISEPLCVPVDASLDLPGRQRKLIVTLRHNPVSQKN